MNRKLDGREFFQVAQIALGVAMSVFLAAIYVRSPLQIRTQTRDIHLRQLVYVVDVKYLPSPDAKPSP